MIKTNLKIDSLISSLNEIKHEYETKEIIITNDDINDKTVSRKCSNGLLIRVNEDVNTVYVRIFNE